MGQTAVAHLTSDFIEDHELRKIAKLHGLDDWYWGENPAAAALMMEGAAIAIRQIYQEGRDVTVFVHQSGTMLIDAGAFLPYQVNPSEEVKIDHSMDWDDDPVVRQYECKNKLTLHWDEAEEMFGEGK